MTQQHFNHHHILFANKLFKNRFFFVENPRQKAQMIFTQLCLKMKSFPNPIL